MTSRIPDNGGNQPEDEPVVSDGPSAYFATLPIKNIVNALHQNGIPAKVSNTAGTFVCNHLMYGVCHYAAQKAILRRASCTFRTSASQVVDKPNQPKVWLLKLYVLHWKPLFMYWLMVKATRHKILTIQHLTNKCDIYTREGLLMNKKLVTSLVSCMVLGSVSVYAANPFSDVDASSWAYQSVEQLANAGIIMDTLMELSKAAILLRVTKWLKWWLKQWLTKIKLMRNNKR